MKSNTWQTTGGTVVPTSDVVKTTNGDYVVQSGPLKGTVVHPVGGQK